MTVHGSLKFFVGILKATGEKSRLRNLLCGSKDPDLSQNVRDPDTVKKCCYVCLQHEEGVCMVHFKEPEEADMAKERIQYRIT